MPAKTVGISKNTTGFTTADGDNAVARWRILLQDILLHLGGILRLMTAIKLLPRQRLQAMPAVNRQRLPYPPSGLATADGDNAVASWRILLQDILLHLAGILRSMTGIKLLPRQRLQAMPAVNQQRIFYPPSGLATAYEDNAIARWRILLHDILLHLAGILRSMTAIKLLPRQRLQAMPAVNRQRLPYPPSGLATADGDNAVASWRIQLHDILLHLAGILRLMTAIKLLPRQRLQALPAVNRQRISYPPSGLATADGDNAVARWRILLQEILLHLAGILRLMTAIKLLLRQRLQALPAVNRQRIPYPPSGLATADGDNAVASWRILLHDINKKLQPRQRLLALPAVNRQRIFSTARVYQGVASGRSYTKFIIPVLPF